MLERFKVPAKDAVRVQEANLRQVVSAIFEKCGVPREDARLATDCLVVADLRGVETHGVSNTLRSYVRGYKEGRLNPKPNWRVVHETPATASVDSDRGLGLMVAPKAMQIAIQKAEKTGVGVVVVGNGQHLGMCAYHAMLALDHDMIGICMTSGGAKSMVPTFARDPMLGTNPLAIAVPAKEEAPFVFDAATTTIAGNKRTLAKRVGSKLLPGWVADEAGVPIMRETDPADGQRLLPLGTTRELGSHKGYGLAMAVDIMCGVLSGAGHSMRMAPGEMSHFLAAYRIDAFLPVEDFKKDMDDLLRSLRTATPAPGQKRVLYAGLPEWEEQQERKAKGIPLHKEVVEWF
ncbi:MAG: Ldh family oxidoreductase, partial [Chloroflexota bacterium]|nr:Ldh family oxidoreductase [Chloroflexota bacterium]